MAKKDDKYNRSAKGQVRNKRYEAAHPERKNRWSPIMLYRRGKAKAQ